MLWEVTKGDTSPVFESVFFAKLRYSSKHFAQICRAQYGAAMLVYLHGTPTLQPVNSVDIWSLLWLSGRLVVCTE